MGISCFFELFSASQDRRSMASASSINLTKKITAVVFGHHARVLAIFVKSSSIFHFREI